MSRSNIQQGSYTQLNTLNAEPYSCNSNDQWNPLITQSRTHFTRRDCILVIIIIVAACVMIAVTLALGLPKIREKRERYLNTSFPVSASIINIYENAAVLSDGGPCASIGNMILNKKGSAVDAAIATLFCDGAVNPQSMGLGGGFFMTIYNSTTRMAKVIDARDAAPSGATVDMFQGNSTLSLTGGLSVAVPGELRGYKLAHEKYGKLQWSDLIKPTIDLCKKGFVVGMHLAKHLQNNRDDILAEPSMRKLFYNVETEDIYKEGEIIKRPVLALTLDKISSNPDELYTGDLAKQLVKDIEDFGGIITLEDMKNYNAILKNATEININDKILYSVPPPGNGAILSLILKILEGYKFNSNDMINVSSAVLTYHRMAEAFKYAYARRTELGDTEEANKLVKLWLSPDYGESIRENISDSTTFPSEHYGPVVYSVDDYGTAHVSVATTNGDAVSATSTINTQFGSKRRSLSTGIILNNNMDDFSSPNITNYFGIPPSSENFIAAGKRPLSSMCPSILIDKNYNLKMVIGGAGGSLIPTAIAQVIMRSQWLNEDIKQSVDALRLHHQLYPNFLQYEEGFPKIYLDQLKQYGHEVKPTTEGTIVLGIVREENGKLYTNIDHRKGGSSEGF